MNNKQLPPYDSFFNNLRNSNPLEKYYNDFQNLVNSGLTTEQAVAKLRMDRIPPTGAENYSYLQSIWESNNMQNFTDFLKWYNNKDVVPTLEAMQKMIEFYHNKGIDMLKLGCTLPNLANICLHKSTDSKFYPFIEPDKDLLEKIREDMVGGPSIVFTRKAVVDETFIRKSSNLCKSIVGIDASQLYPYLMCQPMPTGLYTRWEYDSDTNRSTARQNKSRPLRIWFCHTFSKVAQIAKLRVMLLLVDKRRLIASVYMEFVIIATLCLKQWGVTITTAPVKKHVPL